MARRKEERGERLSDLIARAQEIRHLVETEAFNRFFDEFERLTLDEMLSLKPTADEDRRALATELKVARGLRRYFDQLVRNARHAEEKLEELNKDG